MDVKTPTSRRQVEQFLGLVNFFGRLIPNFTTKAKPLNELRRQDMQFCWNPQCESAFQLLKKEISSYLVVQPYDLRKEVTVRIILTLSGKHLR